MRTAAIILFLAGAACGFDLTWWLTHDHCHWSLTCIHLWHHVAFTAAYVGAGVLAYRSMRKGV